MQPGVRNVFDLNLCSFFFSQTTHHRYALDPANKIARQNILKLETSQERKAKVLAREFEHQSMILGSFLRQRWQTFSDRIRSTIIEWHTTMRDLHSLLSSCRSHSWIRRFMSETDWWMSSSLSTHWLDRISVLLPDLLESCKNDADHSKFHAAVSTITSIHKNLRGLWRGPESL